MSLRLTPLLALLCLPACAWAQQAADSGTARPALKSNRWQEDWSPLLDPAARTQPFDRLKAIALGPDAYLSLGAILRERIESNHASAFGVGRDDDSYLLQRLQVHADLRIGSHWQVFTQLEDVRAFEKTTIGPADRNPLDLRMAFVAYTTPLAGGELKVRVGRQEFAFDLQRFVSLRDGPNVRQSFDAVWANYEHGPWRWIGFVSQPVQYSAGSEFDDTSNRHFAFDTLRVERQVLGTDELSLYYARYELDDSTYLDAVGDERRDILDARFAGVQGALDWDLEAMGQRGHVGGVPVQAWGMGGRIGYTLKGAALSPRIGLQVDAASGDRKPGDGRLETFNPLFPNGYYFSLAGYTGYSNLLHIKPALTIHPSERLTVTAAVGLLWRQSTADAVYVQPDVPLAGTAGIGGRWTGAYAQLRTDWKINPNLGAAIELVQYQAGSVIRDAGGSDSHYAGGELKFTW
ncbi:alginate export family protein [Pseudoxanthomonas sp.]|uniref:alginate export family protein n=1 Tax=Pseudoxanthomonas sp. TaxID=1871049 RepID=UPI002605EE67|nr:alginate export family protein [Pseudoxanthomonas sp.]WDS36505.1 MAG: alginate export family protein [Pseudoxanthomonas sp.]